MSLKFPENIKSFGPLLAELFIFLCRKLKKRQPQQVAVACSSGYSRHMNNLFVVKYAGECA